MFFGSLWKSEIKFIVCHTVVLIPQTKARLHKFCAKAILILLTFKCIRKTYPPNNTTFGSSPKI